ncbi:MAG: hypothetical protein LBU65_15725 [Planctomycetaceae bacterium]|jgi:adenosylhomocysteine nucleosidase|nr:hypothetical protein [Planctomycetaceae bacterium]
MQISLAPLPHTEIGLIFAMPTEANGVVDKMSNRRTIKGKKFRFHYGSFAGCGIAVVESGIGRANAAEAANVLYENFRPEKIILAGYSGSLSKACSRNAIIVPQRFVLKNDGKTIEIRNKFNEQPTSMTLLTSDEIVRTANDKHELNQNFGAEIVDMESYAVVEYCNEKGIPLAVIRIVFDEVDEDMSEEVTRIVDTDNSTSKMLGTLVGSLFRKPKLALELYKLKEHALIATDKLAKKIEEMIKQ